MRLPLWLFQPDWRPQHATPLSVDRKEADRRIHFGLVFDPLTEDLRIPLP
jgi:hypothetical protein